MKIANKSKVAFFSIFLSLFCKGFVSIYGQSGYEVGTNKITRDIYFRLLVQDSLLVVPESVDLDFGDILKGSTDTKRAETKIKVEAGKDVKTVSAKYEEVGKEVQKDGSVKIQIKYQEEKPQKTEVDKKLKKETEDETDFIDVYMLPFERNYQLITEGDKNQGEIPVKGEIRGVGKAKLGKYKGNIRVQVEVVTTNREEERQRW